MKQAYRRVTDLFVQGTEVVLDDLEGTEPLLVWVQKLNPFQREECVRDGQAARSRLLLTLRQAKESDELTIFRAQMMELDPERLRAAVVDASYSEDFVAVQNELRDDPEWAERLEALDRSAEQLEDRDADDPEVGALSELNTAYLEDLDRRMADKRAERRASLEGLEPAELRRRYEDAYIEAKATTAFLAQYKLTEIFYAARACGARRRDGGFDHGRCDHGARVFDHRSEVRDAPDELLERIRGALDRITMSVREAKNSVRRESSSELSPPPSKPAPSPASGPGETSPELVGTLSSPPATP